jgi:hypothetical protein
MSNGYCSYQGSGVGVSTFLPTPTPPKLPLDSDCAARFKLYTFLISYFMVSSPPVEDYLVPKLKILWCLFIILYVLFCCTVRYLTEVMVSYLHNNIFILLYYMMACNLGTTHQMTQYHIPEDWNLQPCHCENLKFLISYILPYTVMAHVACTAHFWLHTYKIAKENCFTGILCWKLYRPAAEWSSKCTQVEVVSNCLCGFHPVVQKTKDSVPLLVMNLNIANIIGGFEGLTVVLLKISILCSVTQWYSVTSQNTGIINVLVHTLCDRLMPRVMSMNRDVEHILVLLFCLNHYEVMVLFKFCVTLLGKGVDRR